MDEGFKVDLSKVEALSVGQPRQLSLKHVHFMVCLHFIYDSLKNLALFWLPLLNVLEWIIRTPRVLEERGI